MITLKDGPIEIKVQKSGNGSTTFIGVFNESTFIYDFIAVPSSMVDALAVALNQINEGVKQ